MGKYETLGEDIQKLYMILNDAPAPIFDIERRPSSNREQNYIEMYENFDSIFTIFEYYYDDIVNFKYTFNNSEMCTQTEKCFKLYEARKN